MNEFKTVGVMVGARTFGILKRGFWFVPLVYGIISAFVDLPVLRKAVGVSNSDDQNPGLENPYSATYVSDSSPGNAIDQQLRSDGYTQQIPVIGILMIVQGALEALYAMFILALGVFMSTIPIMRSLERNWSCRDSGCSSR